MSTERKHHAQFCSGRERALWARTSRAGRGVAAGRGAEVREVYGIVGGRGQDACGEGENDVQLEAVAPEQLEPLGSPVEHYLEEHEEDRQDEVWAAKTWDGGG